MPTDSPHRDSKTLMPSSSDWVQALGQQNRPVLNGDVGGQHQFAPNIFRYVSESPHIQQQAYIILLSTPSFFSKLPAGNKLASLTKSMFENRCKSFEGLTKKYETEFGELKWTGRTMSVPIGGTLSLGTLTLKLDDVEGEVYTHLLEIWTQYGLHDPTIGHAKIITMDDPGDLLIDSLSVSAIIFEPTRNFRDISHACLAVGMMPHDTPQIEMRRNKEESGALREIQTEYTGLLEYDTLAAYEIARIFLSKMELYNPDGRSAPYGFKERTATLESVIDAGTIEQMAQQASTVTNPTYLG